MSLFIVRMNERNNDPESGDIANHNNRLDVAYHLQRTLSHMYNFVCIV